MFWSCCGFGRKQQRRRDSEEPDETTRLLATSDALFPQVQEAPKPIDDEALLEYRRRIDRILEETAEKLVSVSTGSQHPLAHHIRSDSCSSGSTSTAKVSRSTRAASNESSATGTGRDTPWRPGHDNNSTVKGSVYSMKPVSSPKSSSSGGRSPAHKAKKQSTKAKGKQVAREVAGLPNGAATAAADSSHDDNDGQEEHDRDGTLASYRTAREADLDADEGGDLSEEDESIEADEDDDEDEESEASISEHSSGKRSGTGHNRSKRSRPAAQDIFQSESLAKTKPQERIQKALTMSDQDFARQLTQQS